MLTQNLPFGMFGLGQMAGWPQYPVPPQLLQAYQQDPYGILARTGWPVAPATNPWVVQALLGELVATIARQGHAGLGHFGQPFIGQPFASPFQAMIGGPFTPQGSYGNGIGTMGFAPPGLGTLGAGPIGAGLPLPAGVGNWSVPAMAMV